MTAEEFLKQKDCIISDIDGWKPTQFVTVGKCTEAMEEYASLKQDELIEKIINCLSAWLRNDTIEFNSIDLNRIENFFKSLKS